MCTCAHGYTYTHTHTPARGMKGLAEDRDMEESQTSLHKVQSDPRGRGAIWGTVVGRCVLVPWWLVQPGQEWKQSMWPQENRSVAAIPLGWADLQEGRVIQCPLATSPKGHHGAQPAQPITTMQDPLGPSDPQVCPQVWWGGGISHHECIYKCTAVPISQACASPSTNAVRVGLLCLLAWGPVFPMEEGQAHIAGISL